MSSKKPASVSGIVSCLLVDVYKRIPLIVWVGCNTTMFFFGVVGGTRDSLTGEWDGEARAHKPNCLRVGTIDFSCSTLFCLDFGEQSFVVT